MDLYDFFVTIMNKPCEFHLLKKLDYVSCLSASMIGISQIFYLKIMFLLCDYQLQGIQVLLQSTCKPQYLRQVV